MIIKSFIAGVLLTIAASGQNFFGSTGGLKTPSADVIEFRNISGGFGIMRDYYYPTFERTKHLSIWVNVGILPGLEFGLRLGGEAFPVKPEKPNSPFYNLDRMVNIKYRIIENNDYVPSIAIGVQDFIGRVKRFNSFYIVVSEKLLSNDLEFSIGAGSKLWDMISIEAADYRFIGLFGSVVYSPYKKSNIILEYDTEDINLGCSYILFDLVEIKAALVKLQFAGGMCSIKIGL